MALENPPRLLFFEAVFIEDNEGRATQRHGQIGQILHEILLSHSCNPVNRLWLMCMYMFRFGIIRMMVPSLLKWKQLCDCVVFFLSFLQSSHHDCSESSLTRVSCWKMLEDLWHIHKPYGVVSVRVLFRLMSDLRRFLRQSLHVTICCGL